MKPKTILIVLLFSLLTVPNVFSQGFQAPAEGKAAVYFARVTMYGAAVSFEFFHQDKFIGVFKGKNYMRYECEPGEQLFWASSENKEFVQAELEAGKTYIVLVNVIMGAWKARVGLAPIDASNEKDFTRVKELVNKKKPMVTPQKAIDKITVKLEKKGFIKDKLEKYESEWKNSQATKKLTPEMAIPEDKLN